MSFHPQTREPAKMESQERKIFFLILLYSLAIKGVIAYSITVPNVDAIKYIYAARAFSLGNFKEGIRLYPLPLYPFLLNYVHFFIHDWLRASQFLSVIPLALLTLPLYSITRSLFGHKAALWSIAAYSLAPTFNGYAGEVIRDPLGLLFISLAILSALKAFDTAARKYFILTSLFSILVFLTRIETIFFFPFFIIFSLALITFTDDKKMPLLKGLCLYILVPFCFFITLLLMANQDIEFFIHLKLFRKHLQDLLGGGYLRNYHRLYAMLTSLSTAITGNLMETVKHYMWFIYLIAIVEAATKLIFPANIIPLFIQTHNKYDKNHYFLLGIILLFSSTAYVNLIFRNVLSRRYLIIPVFFLFPWVGRGLEKLYAMAVNCRRAKYLAMGFVLLVFIALPGGKTITSIGEKNISLKQAGRWVNAAIGEEKDIILAGNDVRIPYLAGVQNKFFYQKNVRRIESFADKHQANLLIIIISPKKKNTLPALKKYVLLKKYHDQKNIIIIAGEQK